MAGLSANPTETVLILFALAGLVTGCFRWSSSPLFASLRLRVVDFAASHGLLDPLALPLPWWALTNYPERNDVMLPLDAVSLLFFVIAFAGSMAASLTLLVACANLCLGRGDLKRFHHLVQALIPVTACVLFTGLLSLPADQLRMDGIGIPWLTEIKWVALPLSVLWSARLGYQVARRYHPYRIAAICCSAIICLAAALVAGANLGLMI